MWNFAELKCAMFKCSSLWNLSELLCVYLLWTAAAAASLHLHLIGWSSKIMLLSARRWALAHGWFSQLHVINIQNIPTKLVNNLVENHFVFSYDKPTWSFIVSLTHRWLVCAFIFVHTMWLARPSTTMCTQNSEWEQNNWKKYTYNWRLHVNWSLNYHDDDFFHPFIYCVCV